MAQYNYKAMDKNGKAKKGSIEAINYEFYLISQRKAKSHK